MNARIFVRSWSDSRTRVWSWTHKNACVHVQTLLRESDHERTKIRAFMSRLSYDSLIMNALKFVRSCPDFRAFMSRLSCVRQTFVRSCPDFRAFMSRLSCVRQTFVHSCSDFRAFFDVSRLCNFERTTPPRAFIFGLDILASVWDLNLGSYTMTDHEHVVAFIEYRWGIGISDCN